MKEMSQLQGESCMDNVAGQESTLGSRLSWLLFQHEAPNARQTSGAGPKDSTTSNMLIYVASRVWLAEYVLISVWSWARSPLGA